MLFRSGRILTGITQIFIFISIQLFNVRSILIYLKEITHELKGIGRSINQLVVLCNMGRIKEVHLGDAWQSLSQVYLKLQELTDREVR